MIDPGRNRRVRAVQITPDAADTLNTLNTLYDATWPKNNAPEQLQALMKVLTKKLVEKTN